MTWVVLAVTLAVVFLGLKYPKYLPVLLVITFPLEISRTWFPHVSLFNKLGAFLGVIDLGRIFTLLILGYVAVGLIFKGKFKKLVGSRHLFWILIGYVILAGISSIWSVDRMKTFVEVFRLGVLVLLGFSVYQVCATYGHEDIWLIPKAFAIMATLLGIIGVYEAISSQYLWLGEVYRVEGRANATFVDANIYARYLIIGILSTLSLLTRSSTKSGQLPLLGALLIQLAALLVTGSRTGILAGIIVVIAFFVFLPKREWLFLIGAGMITAIGISLMNQTVYTRLLQVKENPLLAATARDGLIRAGLDMFTHSPVLGVGQGGFQHVMLTNYQDLIIHGVSLSHTALITTAAELGLIGLSLTVLLVYFLYKPLVSRIMRRTNPNVLSVFAVLAITTIFISAQGEGRFFEDTYLWILFGLLLANPDVQTSEGV